MTSRSTAAKTIPLKPLKALVYRLRHSFFIFGLLSLLWLLFRTGSKPTRMDYPCQRAAAATGSLWLASYALPLALALQSHDLQRLKRNGLIFAGVLIASASIISVIPPAQYSILDTINPVRSPQSMSSALSTSVSQGEDLNLLFSSRSALSPEASSIYAINGTDGSDRGVHNLIDLMEQHNLSFYAVNGSSGIIARDDVVIIKVNCQWDERGGTNTDLVRSIVQAIIEHPQGFEGEVVLADNGQAQFGSTGHGGSLSYARNNALDPAQSVQVVADSFPGHNVSTYLWDTITERRVNEYMDGDLKDGFVVNASQDAETGITITYPKFKTAYGTYISFKQGIWDPANGTYNSRRLKVINVPVLKSHGGYGVTASVKHYMGTTSDRLSRENGGRGRAHNSVGSGGMGTQMAETRFPDLNIVDAIWVNANPGNGPATSYSQATEVGVIAASQDPVALDAWAAREILMPIARASGYQDLSSIDPDNLSPGSFGRWLGLSRDEILKAGYRATTDEDKISLYVDS